MRLYAQVKAAVSASSSGTYLLLPVLICCPLVLFCTQSIGLPKFLTQKRTVRSPCAPPPLHCILVKDEGGAEKCVQGGLSCAIEAKRC